MHRSGVLTVSEGSARADAASGCHPGRPCATGPLPAVSRAPQGTLCFSGPVGAENPVVSDPRFIASGGASGVASHMTHPTPYSNSPPKTACSMAAITPAAASHEATTPTTMNPPTTTATAPHSPSAGPRPSGPLTSRVRNGRASPRWRVERCRPNRLAVSAALIAAVCMASIRAHEAWAEGRLASPRTAWALLVVRTSPPRGQAQPRHYWRPAAAASSACCDKPPDVCSSCGLGVIVPRRSDRTGTFEGCTEYFSKLECTYTRNTRRRCSRR